MSKAKKIISMLLAIAMVLTVVPASVLASAADVNYSYGAVSFSKTEFTVDTSATTEVIRVAAAAGSFSLPAQGAAGVIVSATPSGIPQNGGTYAAIGYAKLELSAPKLVFTINGADPDEIPKPSSSVSGISVGSGVKTTSGNSHTYTYDISGNAIAHTDVVFTIPYKVKGVEYNAFAFSHVEHILVMPGYSGYSADKDSAGDRTRLSTIVQLQSKNMYTDTEWHTSHYRNRYQVGTDRSLTNAYVNYASTSALKDTDGSTRNALLGAGSEDNADGSMNAYVAAVPSDSFTGYENGTIIKASDGDDTNKNRANTVYGLNGNRSAPYVYVDKKDDFNDYKMRLTVQPGEAADAKVFQFCNSKVMTTRTPFDLGSEGWNWTQDSSLNGVWAPTSTTAGSTNSESININQNRDNLNNYLMATIGGTGPTADCDWQISADVQVNGNCDDNNTIYQAGAINVLFRVYDSTVLDQIFYGVFMGKSKSGSASYTAPNGTVYTFNKAVNPQKSMYSEESWAAFETAYKAAGSLLAAPDLNYNVTTNDRTSNLQTVIDNAVTNLWNAYQGLTGYNATVNWKINHYLEGTTTPVIPTQTIDPAGVYGQGQPAGSTWIANAATIDGYRCTSNASQNMTISGKNSEESFTFYYRANTYNFIVNTGVGTDSDETLTQVAVDSRIYKDTLDTGTKPYYTFDDWYLENGDKAFTLSDDMGEYLIMPARHLTLYGRWVTTPIDIHYVPVYNDGTQLIQLPEVSRGEQATFNDAGTATFNRPSNLDVDGYIFVEYYADPELTTPVSWPLTFTLGQAETPYIVYARVVDVNGRISFETNGGSLVNDITFTADTTVNKPADPTMEGYSFAGWWDETYTTQYFANGTQYMPNMTGFIAYAKWTADTHTISFKLDAPTTEFDTASLASISGPSDTVIDPDDLPPVPKKFGYIFHHWELDGQVYDLEKYPRKDIELTPHWVETDYSAFIGLDAYEKLSGVDNPVTVAQVGDVVTFRMTSQTNFYTGSSVFVFMYDSNFFTPVKEGNSAFKLNSDSEYISGINATALGVTDDTLLPWPDDPEVVNDHNGGYKAMMVAIDPQVTSSNYQTAPMNDGKWVVEFQLRINDNATGSGTVKMHNAWTRTADNIMGTMFYGWSNKPSDVYNTYNSVVEPDLTYATATVSIDETQADPDTTVTLNANGGKFADGATTKTYTGRAETEIIEYVAPEYDGYTLSGWANTVEGGAEWIEPYYPVVENTGLTYDAQWTPNTYTATFYKETDGATVYYSSDYQYLSTITGPANPPSKQGYVFDKWVDAEGNEVDLATFAGPIDGINLYATYAPADDTPYIIRINYTNNMSGQAATRDTTYKGTTGKTVIINTTADSDDNTIDILLADLPVISGYEFDTANNSLPITGVIAPDGSLVLEVAYKAGIVDVILDANGGTYADGETTVTISGEFQTLIEESELPVAPTRTGYEFGGYSGFTLGTARYLPNRTYKATWNAKSFDITFDANGGAYADSTTSMTSTGVKFGSNITATETPTRTGYNFLGWSVNQSATAADETMKLDTEGDRTYYAVWQQKTYTVTYYVDNVVDTTLSIDNAVHGQEITIAAAPVKEGYIFSGWKIGETAYASGSTYTINDASVEIKGTFSADSFDVTFDGNGGYFDGDETVKTKAVSVVYDTTIAPPASPARKGYEFIGWADSAENAAAKTVITTWPTLQTTAGLTFYAVWNATNADYTVKYYYQGVEGGDNYVLDDTKTVTYNGLVETEASINPNATETGFTLNTEKSKLSGEITPEPNLLTLEVYYDRNIYKLYTVVDGKTSAGVDYYYGADVTTPEIPAKEGYDATGWSPAVVSPMPANNQTITAVYTPKQYTVTFYTDETKAEVEYTRTAAYLSDYNVPQPNKEGHKFLAWINATTGQASGLTEGTVSQIPLNGGEYYATWEVISYKLVYRTYNGEYATYNVPYGTPKADWDVPETNPTREGYTFNGWSTVADETMPAGQVNLVALWNKETYTVTWNFNDNGATENLDEPYQYQDAIYAPSAERTGYEFNYWMDADGNEFTATTMPDIGDNGATVMYTAKWTAYSYDAIFNANGGAWGTETTKNVPTDFDADIVAPEDPVREGYEFGGWDPEVGKMTEEGMEFTAKWTPNANTKYTINTYTMGTDGNYGAAVATEGTGTTDTQADATPESVATGFELDTTKSTLKGNIAADGSLVLSVYIKRNQYTFKAVADGAEVVNTTYYYEQAVTAPEVPAKTGYTGAWDIAVPATMPANDVTLTAVYTAKTYDVIYIVDGAEYERVEDVAFGTDVAVIAEPTKEGYTFSGWDKTGTFTMPDGDVTITGSFGVNKYAVIYMVDGEEYETVENVAYGTEVVIIDEPTKEGYTFSGWSEKENFLMPDNTVTITGTFTVNTYDIIYNVDGEEYSRVDDVPYGTEFTVIDEPTKEGYSFSGWSQTGTLVMGTADIIITGTFTINTYVVTFVDASGAMFSEEELEYGATIAAPVTNPELTNYIFEGWSLTEIALGTKAAPVDKATLIDFEKAAPTVPANDITIYPAYNRVKVTLTIKANSTTVIDKDRAEDPVTGYIYGLETKLTKDQLLDKYIEVVGDGELKVTTTKYNRCGTGTKVEVWDSFEPGTEPEEVYYIIIFGDVNGDSAISAADVAVIDTEVAGITAWSTKLIAGEANETYDYCKVLAADVGGIDDANGDSVDDDGYAGNGSVNAVDISVLNSAVLGYGEIDQTTGAYSAI